MAGYIGKSSSVTLGVDTTGNYVSNVSGGNGITAAGTPTDGWTPTLSVDINDTNVFTSTNTVNRVVKRDASGNFAANVISATSTSAQYADLAENFVIAELLEPGTVTVINSLGKLEACEQYASNKVAGVVSTNPAHLMASTLGNSAPIALAGSVPCKVIGPVNPGDILVTSNTVGHAEVLKDGWTPGCTVGKALQRCDEGLHTISIMVGSW